VHVKYICYMYLIKINKLVICVIQSGCHGGGGCGGEDGDRDRNWRPSDHDRKRYAHERKKVKTKSRFEEGILMWVSFSSVSVCFNASWFEL